MASFHAYFKLSWVEVQWVHQFFENPIKIRLFLVRMIITIFFVYFKFSRNHNYVHHLIVALSASIFSLYNIKLKLTKFFVDFIRFFVNFQTFIKIIFFEVINIHKPSLESCEVPHTIWTRSVQTFWRLLDTNRQKKDFLKKTIGLKKTIKKTVI